MTRKSSFPPIVRVDTRLLLLGSLPGEASLRAARYYAHPQNQFWRLVGSVIGVKDLHQLCYEEKLTALIDAGIGLWDVVADAVRPGSLDGAIRDHRPNDLRRLVDSLPALRVIGFNGGTAARIGRKLIGDSGGVVLQDLPSSSPAYTLSFARKLLLWTELGEFLRPSENFPGNRPKF
jgi:TDG/mug DNA glycosylase family protein